MISQHIHNLFSAIITNILLHLQKLHHNSTRRRKIYRNITTHLTGLMDAAQWPQEMVVVKPSPPPSMEDMGMGMGMVVSSSSTTSSRPPSQLMERKARPQKEQALNCPRCNSTNTKFCYYNNYSLTQPRYFCKTCRRYWTEGGSLRNVPVGGGSRKNKRSSTTTPSTTTTNTNTNTSKLVSSDLIPQPTQNPKFHEGHDLNLTFSNYHSALGGNPNNLSTCPSSTCSTTVGVNPSALSAMEFLRSGVCSRGMMSPFMPLVQEGGGVYQTPPGFGLQEFRSSGVCFSVEGVGGYNDHQNNSGSGVQKQEQQEVQECGGGRMLFPFEDLRHVSPNPTAPDQFDQNRGQEGDSSVFWSGVMGGGAAW